MSLNQTSSRMAGIFLWLNLSTNLMPVIISAGSMPPPMIPRTMLFHSSSTVPPPRVGFNCSWKWPPFAFSGSSHSGRIPFLKIIKESTMVLPPSFSLMNFLPLRSSLGCGRWFQQAQKSLTVLKEADCLVTSAQSAFLSFGWTCCSQIVQVYCNLGLLFFSFSSSAGSGAEPRSLAGVIWGLKLRKGVWSSSSDGCGPLPSLPSAGMAPPARGPLRRGSASEDERLRRRRGESCPAT
mmetsp:Transcript_37438/g.85109  ORF Transcript_37438/g.85109 Transcript_37438/m.85109 type:complete len:237 (+) Transcript_37438:362-1072(+)